MNIALRSIAISLLAGGCSLANADVVAHYQVNMTAADARLLGTITTSAFGHLDSSDFVAWNFVFEYGGETFEFPGANSPVMGCAAAGCGVLAGSELRYQEPPPYDEGLYFGPSSSLPGVFFDAYGATVNFMPQTGGGMHTYQFLSNTDPYVIGRLPIPSSLPLAALALGALALARRPA